MSSEQRRGERDAGSRPRVLVIIPSGEGVRNFVYSEAINHLAETADVTLLSIVAEDAVMARVRGDVRYEQLDPHPERPFVGRYRMLAHTAHFRWIWSQVAQNNWEMRDAEAEGIRQRLRWIALKAAARTLGHRRTLEVMTGLERRLSYRFRATRTFDALLDEVRPDLVFNTMHVHGPAGDLPVRVARAKGIHTSAFIYSWDNLTSRSRIFAPYDEFLVWTSTMREDLLEMYHDVQSRHVHVVGSPQFDFLARPEHLLDVRVLGQRLGFDPERPFVLYTTGVDRHFPEEHRTVAFVADALASLGPSAPQLVVRTYVKGTSEEMQRMLDAGLPNTVVAPMEWDERYYTSSFDDVSIYTSLLHHCAFGINAASTVTLELLYLGKQAINLWLDPPGAALPPPLRWSRHIDFDHFEPVARSGATLIAHDADELRRHLHAAMERSAETNEAGVRFIEATFGEAFSGHAGVDAATVLSAMAYSAAARR